VHATTFILPAIFETKLSGSKKLNSHARNNQDQLGAYDVTGPFQRQMCDGFQKDLAHIFSTLFALVKLFFSSNGSKLQSMLKW